MHHSHARLHPTVVGDVNHVEARIQQNVLIERYQFAPDVEVELPRHSHSEYQIGLAPTHAGQYTYRRSFIDVPIGSISVIHPGEVHAGCGFRKREDPIEFYSFYVPTDVVAEAIQDCSGQRARTLPFIAPILIDSGLERRLRELHRRFLAQSLSLETEALWMESLFQLFLGPGHLQTTHKSHTRKGVQRVREFLDSCPETRVTLRELARIADLTVHHLSRSFHDQIGMPLHSYQNQRRVDRAKRLLLEGAEPADVAVALGFSHQSHFGKVFRKYLQTSPSLYAFHRLRRRNAKT